MAIQFIKLTTSGHFIPFLIIKHLLKYSLISKKASITITSSIHSIIGPRFETYKGLKYKIRISEHVKNIVRNDSISKKLGLFVTSSIENSQNLDLRDNSNLNTVPLSSAINPLGTVLYGPNPKSENFDKRLRLEIFYTEINN